MKMVNANTVWRDVQKIRAESPLIHNITNYVVMNTTANALLSIGASPVMAHALEEVEEMVGIARALVINIGTLSTPWIKSMKKAVPSCKETRDSHCFGSCGCWCNSLAYGNCS